MTFLKRVMLSRIYTNPYQPRGINDPEETLALAQDIKANGLLQVPSARAVDGNGKPTVYSDECRVQLVFGHRRFLAYQILAREDSSFLDMPLNIVDFDDERMAISAWSENEARKQLNPVERARAVARMIEVFGWTQAMAAEKIKVDRSTVTNLLAMLRLPLDILQALALGTISSRQAMALMPFYDLTPRQQLQVQEDGDFCEFLQFARQGQISSDVIRKTIAEKVEARFPKEDQADEDPQKAVTPLFDLNTMAPNLTPDPFPSREGEKEPEEEGPTDVETPEWIQDVETGSEPEQEAVDEAPAAPTPAARQEEKPVPFAKPAQAASPAKIPEPAGAPKSWAESFITMTIVLRPKSGESARRVTIGGRVNEDEPVFDFVRETDINFSGPLADMLERLSINFSGGKS
jgi:ParB/RepB/Spo0J family partition protein